MGKLQGTYNLRTVDVIIGGYDLGGYSEDGGVTIKWKGDLGSLSIGADGDAAFVVGNDESAEVEITVGIMSLAYKNLAALAQAQKAQAADGPIDSLNFSMRDRQNGDSVKDPDPVFLKLPDIEKKKGIGTATFLIGLPSARSTAAFGTSNTK